MLVLYIYIIFIYCCLNIFINIYIYIKMDEEMEMDDELHKQSTSGVIHIDSSAPIKIRTDYTPKGNIKIN